MSLEVASLIVSGIAVLIAAGSWWSSHKIGQRQLRLEEASARLAQKQLASLEEAEKVQSLAKLDAEFVGGDGKYHLVISNVGGGEARDVYFSVDGAGYPFIASEVAEMFPLAVLRPGKSVRLIAAFHMQSPREYSLSLRWTNPDGSEARDTISARW